MTEDTDAIVTALRDLTRIIIAVQGKFDSRAEAIRQLDDLSIPPARIARIFDIPTNHVTSVLSRRSKKVG